MKINGHRWAQRRRDIQITGKYWLLLLVVTNAPYVLTCNFEYDTKGITNDRHMYLSILISSIIIIYIIKGYETFWQRKNDGCRWGQLLTLPLSWLVPLMIMLKEFTLIDTLFWDSWSETLLLSMNTMTMRYSDEGKCWPFLWDIADGQSVMGSGYWPHTISDYKSLLLLDLDWSQILMIW